MTANPGEHVFYRRFRPRVVGTFPTQGEIGVVPSVSSCIGKYNHFDELGGLRIGTYVPWRRSRKHRKGWSELVLQLVQVNGTIIWSRENCSTTLTTSE